MALRDRADLAQWKPGSAWLAGGSWLFSEPQTSVDTLLDLAALRWPSIRVHEEGVEIAATCTFAQLYAQAWQTELTSLTIAEPCCKALLGSFKVWNVATVGGNICLALPAGPMTAFTTALDGVGVIWQPDGTERRVPVKDFITGVTRNALEPGEILRSIELPMSALRRRGAIRKVSLSTGGRSAALLVGMRDGNAFLLTITASTPRPYRLDFAKPPSASELREAIDTTLSLDAYHDDVHGRPPWRQHITRLLAEELREELVG